MYSKWKIKGVDNYRFGEDGELYRMPYETKDRNYGAKKVSKQVNDRYYINGKLTPLSYLIKYKDDDPINIPEDDKRTAELEQLLIDKTLEYTKTEGRINKDRRSLFDSIEHIRLTLDSIKR
jgi:hypothetical protein